MNRPTSIEQATNEFDRLLHRWGPPMLWFGAGLLWLSNVSWKVPPEFGRVDGGCRGLCGYVKAGTEFPVVPGSAWFFREIVGPNLAAFGWFTLLSEAVLAALLLAGRYLRIAGVLGIMTSIGIFASVANADHEWYWSYLLMALVHLAVMLSAEQAPRPAARSVAIGVAIYGAIVAVAHSGAAFTGDGNRTWRLFAARNDIPGDFGRNVFPGSVLLGLILAVTGIALAVLAPKLDATVRRAVGWGLVVLSGLLLITYGVDGTIIALGSRASTAAVVAALGFALAVDAERSGPRGSAVESSSVPATE